MRYPVALIVLLPAMLRCQPAPDASALVELRVGTAASESVNFQATTSLAEYIEIPGAGNELRLTLANYAASCDSFEPPDAKQASISVVITTPVGVTPTSGVYPWLGHDAHGGDVRSPAKPYSFPTARLGSKSYIFRPGGAVVLNGLTLSKHGSVSGLLNFEYSGDAKHPATSLKGRFSSRICRYSSDESS